MNSTPEVFIEKGVLLFVVKNTNSSYTHVLEPQTLLVLDPLFGAFIGKFEEDDIYPGCTHGKTVWFSTGLHQNHFHDTNLHTMQ